MSVREGPFLRSVEVCCHLVRSLFAYGISVSRRPEEVAVSASVFFLILAVLVCTFVVIQVRNQRMKERYAALWLIIGTTIIVLGVSRIF